LEFPGNERDLVAELAELRKCFDKSELVRKQQKILIGKMKDQIEAESKSKENSDANAKVKVLKTKKKDGPVTEPKKTKKKTI